MTEQTATAAQRSAASGPPQLSGPVIDLTLYGESVIRDPYPFYAELRRRGPAHLVRMADGVPVWLVVGHDQARAVLADPRFSKVWANAALPEFLGERADFTAHMLNSDPPRHTRLRRLVSREFTPRRIAGLQPRVRQLTDTLLDAMLARPGRRADLVAALSFPLPISVICELLGVPGLDREKFRRWTAALLGDTTAPPGAAAPDLAAAQPAGDDPGEPAPQAMNRYLTELVAAKRERPGEDLMSALIRTHDEDGDRLSPAELVGMAFLLLVAGHETTVNLITNAVLALLTHPEQLAALRADPDGLLDAAIEETLRWDGPVERATYRFPTEPVDLGGTRIPAGHPVLVVLASAGRDPGQYPDADRFDIHRPARPHLAFGHGIHYCLGAPLARLEARVALRALLDRCPGLALDTERAAGPEELPWRPGLIMRGPSALPVRY